MVRLKILIRAEADKLRIKKNALYLRICWPEKFFN